MRGKEVCHSTGKDDWGTPRWLFDQIQKELQITFDLDAAADDHNHLCKDYFTEKDDALIQSWECDSAVWLNPPYSLNDDFIEKAYFESIEISKPVVCLIPSRTCRKFWHNYVMKADEILFCNRRIIFVGSEDGAPFPSSIVVFRPNIRQYPMVKSFHVPLPKIQLHLLEQQKKGEKAVRLS